MMEKKINNKENKSEKRPPIVVIMGHIDHGKSTLLDYIRKTDVVSGEAGGITQHIRVYEVDHKTANGTERRMVFLDTPGHEAFGTTRERGSKAADIAVLVVSAEDGVKPQTLEAINWSKSQEIPLIVAINKIDKPNANIDKIKQELAEKEIFLEGWGGTVAFVPISAKTGEGIPELLEMILLQTDLDNLSANPSLPASGIVIESHRDQKRGICATLIIHDGTLRKRTYVTADDATAPVRNIEDFLGQSLEEAGPSKPVVLVGWDKIPKAGSRVEAYSKRGEAEDAANNAYLKRVEEEKLSKKKGGEAKKMLPVVMRADTLGSVDAILHELKKLDNESIALRFLISDIGPIGESDLKQIPVGKESLVFGFNVKVDQNAREFAMHNNIDIKIFSVIYELVDWVKESMERLSPKEEVEEISGTAKVLKIFSVNKNKQVIGGKVEEGLIDIEYPVRILRREVEIGEGRIKELQSHKEKTSTVNEGAEFGMLLDSKIEVAAGDKISCYRRVIK